MSFIASIFGGGPKPPAPPPPAPAPKPVAPVKQTGKERLRGGAGGRRGSETILSGGDTTTLGATGGKTLLGQ